MQTKAQLVDAILQINPTARADWLAGFDVAALERYLEHLQHALEPRGRSSYWFRNDETPAVVTRKPAA